VGAQITLAKLFQTKNELLGLLPPPGFRINWSPIQVFLSAILLDDALGEIRPVQHGPFQTSCSLTSDEIFGVVPSKASYYMDILHSKGSKRVI
jgi:hypothetical protein